LGRCHLLRKNLTTFTAMKVPDFHSGPFFETPETQDSEALRLEATLK
jgi:hypothetical protein